MWQFRIVKTSKTCFEALGYFNGVCQGSYWHSRDEKTLRHVVATKWPNIEIF